MREPDGLLAAGGDLHPERLLNAYSQGIFPWFSGEGPILWWSPDPRMVFDTGQFRLPSRFLRSLRKSTWRLRADTCFGDIVSACASSPRPGQDGTWISAGMHEAYLRLHQLGHAHSVEVFDDDLLVGGIYGVAIGRMFFGESMFSARPGGSKVALAALARLLWSWNWPLIDAQVENPHLLSLGARRLGRKSFLDQVQSLARQPGVEGPWCAHLCDRPAKELAQSVD